MHSFIEQWVWSDFLTFVQCWRKKWVYNCCAIKQSGRKALHVFEQRDIGWLECYTSTEIIRIEIYVIITNKSQCIAFLTGSEVIYQGSTPAVDNAKYPRLVHWRVPVTSTRVIFFTLASSWQKLTTVIPLHIKHIPAATLVQSMCHDHRSMNVHSTQTSFKMQAMSQFLCSKMLAVLRSF